MPRPLPHPAAANQVRIIGGEWRRRLLRFPHAADLRPTPDRVRETLFNWLGQDLTDLSVLDLFAGSGALSFEALSRGARLAVAVDTSRAAVTAMRANAATLGAAGLEIHCRDATAFLATDTRAFDVIFIDPPFADEGWAARLWPALVPRLRLGGFVYVEQPRQIDPPPGLELIRHARAGRVHYHLLRLSPAGVAPKTDPEPAS
jgi:16S rRNA (guanine966-N2)-methyltransferase